MTQMKNALEKLGVEAIPAAGQTFDPNLHNAVMHVDDEDLGENVVVEGAANRSCRTMLNLASLLTRLKMPLV